MGQLRIATRSSRLARWQAEFVRDALIAAEPGLAVELVPVTSRGDVERNVPLFEVGGVGLFTKEVQEAVLDGRADVAVHSLKDLPTEPHPALCLAAVPERGPEGDVLVAPRHRTLGALPAGARIATSSLRRRAQFLRCRPDLCLVNIRGNVETRLRKLQEEGLDGVVLAEAGLERLGLAGQITERLATDVIFPAVGQGALAIECRADRSEHIQLLARIEHRPTRLAVDAERAFLHRLQGGCQVPIGARTQTDGHLLELEGIVLDPEGKHAVQGRVRGRLEDAAALGQELADRLLSDPGIVLVSLERLGRV